MDTQKIVDELKNCPCGRRHEMNIRAVEIGHGVLERTAAILNDNEFPKKLLLVTDKNALRAADGLPERLKNAGFDITLRLYDDLRVAEEKEAQAVADAAQNCGGILSVGSGSCNDICRRGALLGDKRFALFATAPSMDGFASGTSPITENGFKTTRPARQPEIILGDTAILAAAPAELKAAGFGDMIAKYIALADWQVSRLVTGEYYCERIAALTRKALGRVTALASRVSGRDEETAGAIMEALVLSGLTMKLADCVRPASGTEHIISHFWEIKEAEEGRLSDFHGKKVGVATLYTARLYHWIAAQSRPSFHEDATDWNSVYAAYGPHFRSEIEALNNPTVTAETTPVVLSQNWNAVCEAVRREIPAPEALQSLMDAAGAVTGYEQLGLSRPLTLQALRFHPYMRHRMTLMRLLPMTSLEPDWEAIPGK